MTTLHHQGNPNLQRVFDPAPRQIFAVQRLTSPLTPHADALMKADQGELRKNFAADREVSLTERLAAATFLDGREEADGGNLDAPPVVERAEDFFDLLHKTKTVRGAEVPPASLWDADDELLAKRLVHLPVNDDPQVLRKRTDLTNRMLALFEGVREFCIGPEEELIAKSIHALDLGGFTQLIEGIIARRKVLAA